MSTAALEYNLIKNVINKMCAQIISNLYVNTEFYIKYHTIGDIP